MQAFDKKKKEKLENKTKNRSRSLHYAFPSYLSPMEQTPSYFFPTIRIIYLQFLKK